MYTTSLPYPLTSLLFSLHQALSSFFCESTNDTIVISVKSSEQPEVCCESTPTLAVSLAEKPLPLTHPSYPLSRKTFKAVKKGKISHPTKHAHPYTPTINALEQGITPKGTWNAFEQNPNFNHDQDSLEIQQSTVSRGVFFFSFFCVLFMLLLMLGAQSIHSEAINKLRMNIGSVTPTDRKCARAVEQLCSELEIEVMRSD